MFKLARRRYLREIFSGGSGCTGDCGQGRRCTCETAGKPSNCESKLPIGKTMTREDIISMAVEANLWQSWLERLEESRKTIASLEKFAALVAAQEREECAKLCEDSVEYAADELARQIRARGEK